MPQTIALLMFNQYKLSFFLNTQVFYEDLNIFDLTPFEI